MSWLYCFLNDENYTQPDFLLFSSLEQVKQYCMSNAPEDYEVTWSNSKKDRYRCQYERGDAFQVMDIIPVTVAPEDYILVWHHAYNGVDFEVEMTGSLPRCRDAFKKEQYDCVENGASLDWETEKEAVYDTGEEWEMIEIISVKSLQCDPEIKKKEEVPAV